VPQESPLKGIDLPLVAGASEVGTRAQGTHRPILGSEVQTGTRGTKKAKLEGQELYSTDYTTEQGL
jgi:hypothetical protein